MSIVKISPNISLIDGFDSGLEYRTGTYVLHEEKVTLLESGPSPSVPHVLNGLRELQIDPKDVAYIIVTHIHLDHAGGAGLLLEHCPNATLVVHPRGARHLIDPSRLIIGAKAVYNEQFDEFFHPIIPVSEERILIKKDQETLKIGSHSTLSFFDTPGHSAHHFCIYDENTKGIFSGDTLGVHYKLLEKEGYHLVLPSTSPSQFDPDAMLQSINRIEQLDVQAIYFGHYGASFQPSLVFSQLRQWLPVFVSTGESVFEHQNNTKKLRESLLHLVQKDLDDHNIPRNHPVYEHINLDLHICSLGIIDYLQKNNSKL
ncbi:MBL fold metallo-hydrolase [Alkalihalobacillus sp. MEB130]|uniref:MBL fold metallo-hydrolase n=1 Tax=Alkalihalobacillus sp. MEB130 TaxID=2976704 RepID=UPI0028DE2232|nr:MBL fold metallo-hydrolase [Alkalihalobacillus sp. MEB130]MDT8859943.1 MBL fold metallo-hydrolase [Alkalihalobacillus sp. MEB130]